MAAWANDSHDVGEQRRLLGRRSFVALGAVAAATFLMSGCQAGSDSAGQAGRASDDASAPNSDDALPSESTAGTSTDTTPSQFTELSDTRFYFDTVCKISGTMTQEILEGAFERCAFFQATLSAQEQDSDIDRINKAGGEPVEVEPTTAEVVEKALRYCKESDGLFDITIGAASLLWDFKEGTVPNAEELDEAVNHIDYNQVIVEGTTVQLQDPAGKLDVGGVAKGYIADDLIAYLEDQGVESAFVNLGGNVKTLGSKPDGSPWLVGIQDPTSPLEDIDSSAGAIARVASQGTSVVTSGLYERVFEKDGERYWHILDPHTGRPVETDIVSASIVSDESIDGDGYTKALFMWDDERRKAFFAEHGELQGLLVYSDGRIWTSDNSTIELR